MAIQSTPHTESQQNKDQNETEMDPNQIAARIEKDGAEGIYANMDGAQTGMNRSEHVTDVKGQKHKVEPGASASTGFTSAELKDGDAPGVSNHSISTERPGQEKVIREREEVTLHTASEDKAGEPVRDSVKEGGEMLSKKAASTETVEVSARRAVK